MAKSSVASQLAERLTKIIVLLNNGKSFDLKTLADECGVSERTIARDIARLEIAGLKLNLNVMNNQRMYSLDSYQLGKFKRDDIESFAQLSGVQTLYPSLTESFLNGLLENREQPTYEAKGYSFEESEKFKKLLTMFSEAIKQNQQIGFMYKDEPRVVEPYRLIHHHGSWYLAAVRKGELRTYRISRISQSYQQHELAKFKPDPEILKQLDDEDSIWFGQDKIEVVLKIHAEVVLHFQQRQLFPEQEPVKTLEDGGMLVSSKITHAMQLLPLVRYWIPHVGIVSPEYLQDELEDGLKGYLER